MPERTRAVALILAAILANLAVRQSDIGLRLTAAGDEGRQAVHIRRAVAALARLHIRLTLRLVVVLRPWLMLIARRERLRVARQVRLRLLNRRLRRETRLVLTERLAVIVVV